MRGTAVKVAAVLLAAALVGLLLRGVSARLADALGASPAQGAEMQLSKGFVQAVVTDDQETSSSARCTDATAEVVQSGGRKIVRIEFALPYNVTEEEAAAMPGSTFLLDGLTFKSGTTPGFSVPLPKLAGLSFGLNVTGPKLAKAEKLAVAAKRAALAALAAQGLTPQAIADFKAWQLAQATASVAGAPGVTRIQPGVGGSEMQAAGDAVTDAAKVGAGRGGRGR